MHVSDSALANLLTGLTGAPVEVYACAGTPAPTGPGCAGLYILHPEESAIVLRVDAQLLGALGLALLDGLDPGYGAAPEELADSMREILNILSRSLHSSGRAKLARAITEPVQAEAATRAAAARASSRLHFTASVGATVRGCLALYSIPA